MSGFDLDLAAVESHLDREAEDDEGPRVILGILDGTTPPDEWIEAIDAGNVLVLDIDGDLNELAVGFAREIKEDGGTLMRFRGFLIVTPPDIAVDTDRLTS